MNFFNKLLIEVTRNIIKLKEEGDLLIYLSRSIDILLTLS